ncbi:MAG: hypothetical protein IJ635_02690 [Bacteroidaceae bacterium]|nr:hypothetical protein [Bacteroidaceae bacterium]
MVQYKATRLLFKADVIEALKDSDFFAVETPEGIFRMTKGDFYRDFDNVVKSASYLEKGVYHYPRTPLKAQKYLMQIISGDGISLKIKGKIDLSQFETPKQKSVKSTTKKNVYVIDTNVFVNCPNIISKIDLKCQVVLSAKVIDELDNLKIKLDTEGKRNVEKSLWNINHAMDASNVCMELSDLSLLPDDFSKKSPDNSILAVALKFKNANPIILTSDNGLQVKAKGLGIATISLKDFLSKH